MLVGWDLEAQHKELGQEDQAQVPMPGGPRAVFVLIESPFRAAWGTSPRPSGRADPDQFGHGDVRRGVAQSGLDWTVGLTTQQQPAFTLEVPWRAEVNAPSCPSRQDGSFFNQGMSLPVELRLGLRELLDSVGGARKLLGKTGLFDPELAVTGGLRQVIGVLG